MRIRFKHIMTENLSYKIVALFIALILWLTVLGRRDFTVTKNLELEITAGIGQVVQKQSADHVKVKVSGPRTAVKRFIDSGVSQLLVVDISGRTEGTYDVEIPIQKIDVPFGVKVLSVKPNQVEVQVGKKE